MKLIICGGGGLGSVVAGVASSKGNEVFILTNRPNQWGNEIDVEDQAGKHYRGKVSATSDSRIVEKADVVLLCQPGYLIENTLIEIAKYTKENTRIGSIVSSTGFFFRAHEIFSTKQQLFGFQRVPFIARVQEYGHSAKLLGYKKSLNIAVENIEDKFCVEMSELLGTPVQKLNNYLEASMSNSNPLLHPARLFGMWHDWKEGKSYEKQILFYEDWDLFSSEVLIQCDKEFQRLISKMPIKEKIPPLLEYYESTDAESLTKKIKSISAFKGLKAPMKKIGEMYVPDFSDRYFREDIPFGICLVKEQAVKYGIDTPKIDEIINWSKKIL